MASTSTREVMMFFRGDNRSAVKALEGIAKQSDRTRDSIKGNTDEEAVSLDKVKASSERLRGAMVGLAGMVGIGGLAFGIKDLVVGTEGLQTQQALLKNSLHATGQAAGGAYQRLNEMAIGMSTRGGFMTTQNLNSLAAFVRETKSASEAQSLFSLATNIARARNLDLAQSQNVVARAYTGSIGRLQQLLGPMVKAREAEVGLSIAHQQQIAQIQEQAALMRGPLKTAYVQNAEIADHITAQQAALAQMTDKHTTAQQVLAAATRAFAGSTSVYSRTTQGQLQSMRHAFLNLTETLGQALLPAINKMIHWGDELAQVMAKNKAAVLLVSGAVFALGTAFATVKAATALHGLYTDIRKIGPALLSVGEDGKRSGILAAIGADTAAGAWRAFMAATVVGLVIVGIIEMAEHWKAVEKVVVQVWHAITGAASDAWGWIKGHWELLASILGGPFITAGSFIATRLHQVENAAADVVRFVERVFSAVFGAITLPFRRAFDFVRGGFSDLQHVVGGVTGFLSHPFGLHFAQGGLVPRYLASGGPSGTDTVPAWLSPGEGVLSTSGMQRIGGEPGLAAVNSGAGGMGAGARVDISATPVVVKLGTQVLGQALIHWVQNQEARGSTSLVGGSIQMGGPGLPVGA